MTKSTTTQLDREVAAVFAPKLDFIVVQPTGVLPHFLYAWVNSQPYWLARRDVAKRLTRREAQRIVDQLNARGPINPAHIELAKQAP